MQNIRLKISPLYLHFAVLSPNRILSNRFHYLGVYRFMQAKKAQNRFLKICKLNSNS